MDPITHGVVGLAIASLSGEPLLGAVSIGATLGAMSPDLDIIMQYKGHLAYLKNHRGVSHSIPFLAGIALILSTILSFIFPETAFLKILLWTFLGTLSHTLLDILNTYGAQIFWPLSKKRYSGSLLLAYDPAVIVLSLYILFSKDANYMVFMKAGTLFLVYLFIRMVAKNIVYDKIIHRLGGEVNIKKVRLLPSMTRIHKWHFIVEGKTKFLVGEVNIFNRQFKILKELEKRKLPIYHELVNTKVGEFFNDFTPLYHVDVQDRGTYYYLTFTDLRYIVKDDFLHHATAVVSKELETIQGVFHPYNLNHNVVIA